MARVLVAMSGGVDSSVAAWLLARQGHECVGATMLLHGETGPAGCSDEQAALRARELADATDAAAVAARLGIPHHTVDCTAAFHDAVVRPFVEAYEAGLTPSPCVVCNRRVKFGLLLDHARALGCDYLATGHYARIERAADNGTAGMQAVGNGTGSGPLRLRKAADPAKDQSYFLCLLDQEQLARTLLPLGNLTKPQVRALAEEQGFATARKRESQDVCFVPDGGYRTFLERYRGRPYPPGDVLDEDGRAVGTHAGAVGCTIGQRKGLGVALGRPVYVCAKDMAANTVTVGPAESLMARTCEVGGWNWVGGAVPAGPVRARVRTHYRHAEQPATVEPLPDGRARVVFDEPQRAMAPGQFAVAYDGDVVLGGGAIELAGR